MPLAIFCFWFEICLKCIISVRGLTPPETLCSTITLFFPNLCNFFVSGPFRELPGLLVQEQAWQFIFPGRDNGDTAMAQALSLSPNIFPRNSPNTTPAPPFTFCCATVGKENNFCSIAGIRKAGTILHSCNFSFQFCFNVSPNRFQFWRWGHLSHARAKMLAL